jgi:Mrp family chromosome partitioning ATPase
MTEYVPNLVQRAAARLQRSDHPAGAPPSSASSSALRDAPTFDLPRAPLEALAQEGARAELPGAKEARRVTVSPVTLAAHGITLPVEGFSRTVEEFRALKRQVLSIALHNRNAGAGQSGNRIILVTSARAGEGKTFTAVNLALALAVEKDTRVLLMDADAYRQSLMSFLGISAETGWLDAATETNLPIGALIIGTNIPGLSVLPAGKERPEIPEIMSSRRMAGLLDRLVQEDPRRFIVIDSLPCLSSTEPAILAAIAEQTLFVVAAHQTSRENAESSLRLLAGSPSVSLVLNKAEPLLCEQFKGYGYAYANSR